MPDEESTAVAKGRGGQTFTIFQTRRNLHGYDLPVRTGIVSDHSFDPFPRSQLECGLPSNRKMNKAFRKFLPVLMSSLLIYGCTGPGPSDSATTRTFRLGLIPGAQSFVDFVMTSLVTTFSRRQLSE